MTIIESACISIETQLQQNDNVIILSREGGAAIVAACKMLHRLYDNAQALSPDAVTGWQIDTLDYQALEDFLFTETQAA